jgi:hypothetical protein
MLRLQRQVCPTELERAKLDTKQPPQPWDGPRIGPVTEQKEKTALASIYLKSGDFVNHF